MNTKLLATALTLGAGSAFAQTASAPIPVQTLSIKGHSVKAQIGRAPDAAGQRVTEAMVQALGRRIYGTKSPLTLKVVPTTRASQGYYREIYLSGRPVKIKKLPMTELTLRARNVRLDVPHLFSERKVQTLASQTSLRAVVTEGNLTTLLAEGKRTKSMGMKVKFLSGNRFRVTGNWNWSWFNGPINGVARLQMAGGNKINVDVLSLQLNGAEVPDFVKDKFEEKLNPLIDYNDLPFQPRFKSLKVVGNKAIITA